MIVEGSERIQISPGGHKVKMVTVLCKCGERNLRSLSAVKRVAQYRCKACASHFKGKSYRRGVAPANKQIKCIVACLQCGKQKFKSKRQLEKAKLTFCDARCQNRWQRANTDFNLGNKNPAFKHGERLNGSPAEYGNSFSKELRRQIKIRDNFTCQQCKIQFSDIRGKTLDVHHKDENKFNNDISNLITLCKSCHTKLHWTDLKKAS